MATDFGSRIRMTVFGQSHAPAVGVVLEGIPAGERIDPDELQAFLARRAPGQSALTTARKEADIPEFLSGIVDGVTCGSAITAVIRNSDTRSADYANLKVIPRPGHADYPAFVKYDGNNDIRGGGQFSARLTAPLCIAGGILLQMLSRRGISIGAHIAEIAIQGANMGVVEMTKAMNSYAGAGQGARELAERFVARQNETIERQKRFLRN